MLNPSFPRHMQEGGRFPQTGARVGRSAVGHGFAAAVLLLVLLGSAVRPPPSSAQTEVQFQYGLLLDPFHDSRSPSWIITFQHASPWSKGDNFFFADFLNAPNPDGLNVQDVWMEWYSNLSLGSIFDSGPGDGLVRDVGFLAGVNFGADPNILDLLVGGRLSWTIPGFIFLNTDFMVASDKSSGVAAGGAPSPDRRFVFDINGAASFSFGQLDFLFGGHAEYVSATTNELSDNVPSWILAQPQLTVDIGEAFGPTERLFVGVEYQYWKNKLGTKLTESVPQLLVIWRF